MMKKSKKNYFSVLWLSVSLVMVGCGEEKKKEPESRIITIEEMNIDGLNLANNLKVSPTSKGDFKVTFAPLAASGSESEYLLQFMCDAIITPNETEPDALAKLSEDHVLTSSEENDGRISGEFNFESGGFDKVSKPEKCYLVIATHKVGVNSYSHVRESESFTINTQVEQKD